MEQQNEHHGGIQPPPDCPQLLCQLYNLLLEGNWKRNWPKTSAANRSIGSTTGCIITEKAPTRAFSWLKAPTSAFTFKTLLRHYAKQALTPR